MRLLKNILAFLFVGMMFFMGYAFYISRNNDTMTARQKILKAAYPFIMWVSKITGARAKVLENKSAKPAKNFYDLKATTIEGKPFDFSSLKGKKVLLVNTASDCGFTQQFDELEELYQRFKPSLEIIAFPANDFKEQEKGDDASIGSFCRKNYGVSFPVMSKSVVISTPGQNAVFQWLTHASDNGWNQQAPEWNFSKYLVNETGELTHYFGTGISPLSDKVLTEISH